MNTRVCKEDKILTAPPSAPKWEGEKVWLLLVRNEEEGKFVPQQRTNFKYKPNPLIQIQTLVPASTVHTPNIWLPTYLLRYLSTLPPKHHS